MADLDRFIAAMPAEADGDLMLCRENGVAYQADRSHIVNYDEQYFDKCRSYEGAEIAKAINAAPALVEQLIAQINDGTAAKVGDPAPAKAVAESSDGEPKKKGFFGGLFGGGH